MSKKSLTWTLILAFATCHSPALIRADSSTDSFDESVEATAPLEPAPETSQPATQQPSPTPAASQDTSTQEATEDEENPKGTLVNPADPAKQKSANRQIWTNIAIAAVAVVVAVVSILIVCNNNGTKK